MSRFYGFSAFTDGLMKGATTGINFLEAVDEHKDRKMKRADNKRRADANELRREQEKAKAQTKTDSETAIPLIPTEEEAKTPEGAGRLSDEYSPPPSELSKAADTEESETFGTSDDKGTSTAIKLPDEKAPSKKNDPAYAATVTDEKPFTEEDMAKDYPLIPSEQLEGEFNSAAYVTNAIDLLPWDATQDDYDKIQEDAKDRSKSAVIKNLYKAQGFYQAAAQARADGDLDKAKQLDKGASVAIASTYRNMPNGSAARVFTIDGTSTVMAHVSGSPEIKTETFHSNPEMVQDQIDRLTGPQGDMIFGKIMTPLALSQAETARGKKIENDYKVAGIMMDMYNAPVQQVLQAVRTANADLSRSSSAGIASNWNNGGFRTAAQQDSAVNSTMTAFNKRTIEGMKWGIKQAALDRGEQIEDYKGVAYDADNKPYMMELYDDPVMQEFFTGSQEVMAATSGMVANVARTSPEVTVSGIFRNVAYRNNAENRGLKLAYEKAATLKRDPSLKELAQAKTRFITRQAVPGTATGFHTLIKDIDGNVIHSYEEPLSELSVSQSRALAKRKGVDESMEDLGLEWTTVDSPSGPMNIMRVKGQKVTQKDAYAHAKQTFEDSSQQKGALPNEATDPEGQEGAIPSQGQYKDEDDMQSQLLLEVEEAKAKNAADVNNQPAGLPAEGTQGIPEVGGAEAFGEVPVEQIHAKPTTQAEALTPAQAIPQEEIKAIPMTTPEVQPPAAQVEVLTEAQYKELPEPDLNARREQVINVLEQAIATGQRIDGPTIDKYITMLRNMGSRGINKIMKDRFQAVAEALDPNLKNRHAYTNSSESNRKMNDPAWPRRPLGLR